MAFRGCGRGQMSPQWANVIIKTQNFRNFCKRKTRKDFVMSEVIEKEIFIFFPPDKQHIYLAFFNDKYYFITVSQ